MTRKRLLWLCGGLVLVAVLGFAIGTGHSCNYSGGRAEYRVDFGTGTLGKPYYFYLCETCTYITLQGMSNGTVDSYPISKLTNWGSWLGWVALAAAAVLLIVYRGFLLERAPAPEVQNATPPAPGAGGDVFAPASEAPAPAECGVPDETNASVRGAAEEASQNPAQNQSEPQTVSYEYASASKQP